MIFSEEQINQIKELSEALTPISDIAVLMDLDIDEFRLEIRDPSTRVGKIYRKSAAETALKLRKQEIELANVGSPLAVTLANEYIKEMMNDEDY